MTEQKQACTQQHYQVTERDLPLSCPMPDMPAWDAHPRVYLPIKDKGEAHCPYCGAIFTLRAS
ncbi:zinc-finger domain-containing protein [Methylophaga thiooxydans]|uniref:zinc-finger domain-containing protein n=1 Tax=Methylophaga thiooxydans TaxID=392484 RepID=UPI002357C6FD|nr:zinc-finger domain-containing protein [Methylophaga thiooxydans]